jgi:5-methylcytosine-specific restriction endonuclease McrA
MPPWVAPEMFDSGADPALKLPPLTLARVVESLVADDDQLRPRPEQIFLRAQMRGHSCAGVQTRGMAGWVQPPGWRKLWAATFARWGRSCWRCGAYAGTVDHVLPVALGGGHELDNLRPCCRRCNSSMGASMGNRLRGARPVTTWRTSRRW